LNLTSNASTYDYNILATATGGCFAQLDELAIIQVSECDFGDYQADSPLPTCASPPCHLVSPNLFLGSGITVDIPNIGDINADSDIDDGVNFPNNLRRGIDIGISVTIFNNTGNIAYLSGWVDWNGDGDFEDTNEQILMQSYPNTGSFVVSVPVTIPNDAVLTNQIASRFRLSTDNVQIAIPCGTTTCAIDGEVEDYLIQLECPPVICVPINVNINRSE